MKVGDLVKQISWDGIGIVTHLWVDSTRVSVLFKDGEYDVDSDDLVVISEGR